MTWKERAKKLKLNVPAVFIAMKKKETPLAAKIFAAMTVCYALSPIDLVPDFIPVLGYLDDIVILPVLIALTVKMIPREVFETCQKEAEETLCCGKSKKWYFAIPIIVLWMIILFLIFYKFMK